MAAPQGAWPVAQSLMQYPMTAGRRRDALLKYRNLGGIVILLEEGLKIDIRRQGATIPDDVENRLDQNVDAAENSADRANTGMCHNEIAPPEAQSLKIAPKR